MRQLLGMLLLPALFTTACTTTQKGNYEIPENHVQWQASQKGYQKFSSQIELKNPMKLEEIKKIALLHSIAFCQSNKEGLSILESVNSEANSEGTTNKAEADFNCQKGTSEEREDQLKVVEMTCAPENSTPEIKELCNKISR